MHGRSMVLGVLCMAAVWPCQRSSAATISQTNVEDFLPGVSDGLAVPIIERGIAATGPRNGGVAIVPQPGASVVSDDFNYADQAAAEAAGWTFNIVEPTPAPVPPSAFSFTATPGSLRMSVGRIQDFHNPGDINQKYPVLAYRNTPVTGDFIVETKMTFAEPRQAERAQGIFIGTYTDDFNPLIVDNTLRYIGVGTESGDQLTSVSRMYEGTAPLVTNSGSHTSLSYIIRVVKLGSYYYSFFRTSETQPWIFQQWVRVGQEMDGDAARPLVVGLYAKSWNAGNADKLQNIDFDYFRVSRINSDLAGEYSNVMDAGLSANWRTFSMGVMSMEGLKFQLRTGNAVENGTLSGAGPFVGPDGTANTFFEEDTVNVIPDPNGKRYLEYKLFLDQSIKNIPAGIIWANADFDPAGLATAFVSSQAEWGADGAGVAVQPGGGDLSLARTQTYLDDFSGTTLGAGWTFEAGDPTSVPTGAYSLTERPGYLRLKVGFPQDIFSGDNDLGGVKMLRDLGGAGNDVEVETEVNMEAQMSRAAGLALWLDKDNFAGITLARRDQSYYEVGVLGDLVLANGIGLAPTAFYGSNTMQLRATKKGQIMTFSYRDAASPSPGWHTLYVFNSTKSATGSVDFVPTKVALMSKSYGYADRGLVDVDYNYLKISTVAGSGTKDIDFALPADSRPDALLIYGEGVDPAAAKFQIKNAAGAFIGPDGTPGTFFSVNEPKVPTTLAGLTNAQVRVQLDATTSGGVPYLHAAALTYASGGVRVVRDSNAVDFSGVGVGVDKSVPGVLSGMVELGAPVLSQDFASQPADFLFDHRNVTTPTLTVGYLNGAVRMSIPRPVDTWSFTGDINTKPRAIYFQDKLYTGDYEVETLLNIAEARQLDRHAGIVIVAPRAGGTTTEDKLDTTNLIMFGPYQPAELRFMRAVSNNFGDFGAGGWPGQKFYLKVRKAGTSFIAYARTDESQAWKQISTTDNPNLSSAYVGLLAKAWGGANSEIQNYDFDYLKITPIVATSGTYESRALDLGATGLFPFISTLGGNSEAVQLQWRAADTPEALASAPYIGSDGTAATSFAGTFYGFLPSSLTGKRYFQYKAMLPVGQTLNDVSVVGLTVGPTSPLQDVITALRIAGGLDAATTGQVNSLDKVKGDSAGLIQILDAVALSRTAAGL